jgi:hypothetical protein
MAGHGQDGVEAIGLADNALGKDRRLTEALDARVIQEAVRKR